MGITKKIRAFIKVFVEYTIKEDTRCYRLKGTPITIKKPLMGKQQKEYLKLPIRQNKIIFDNYMGKGYGGNCKYVTEELLRRNRDLDIVWVVKDVEKRKAEFPSGIRLVEYKSEEALKEYFTSAVWVCNYHLVAYFNKGLQKREEQCYIQLWHGSLGIKKIENDCDCLTKSKSWLYLAQKNSTATDYWISNSAFETAVYRRAFWTVKEVLEYGHPRNDLFFKENLSEIEEKVKRRLNIPLNEKIVLYVPTFREDGGFPGTKLDMDVLKTVMEQKFGGTFRIAVRLHPRMEGGLESVCIAKEQDVIRADDYPDIQELLAAAEVVITDYSSCIFDFMLFGRIGFIYAPDIEAYNHERGFYYRLEETPFPIAANMIQMLENIQKFDEKLYQEKRDIFLSGKGCIEDGNASVRVCDLIESALANGKKDF